MRGPFAPRWLALGLICLLAAAGFLVLGQWQLQRHLDKVERNQEIARQQTAPPQDAADAFSIDQQPTTDAEWRHVRVTGEYLPEHTVLVLHRTFAGQAGVEVVVPFRTSTGEYLTIDRGWLPSPGANPLAAVPPPPSGQIEVTGWVRRDGSGASTKVYDSLTRAINSREILSDAGLAPSWQGFLMRHQETPAAGVPLTTPELPEASSGPHLYYAWQWRFFAFLTVAGFGILAYRDVRGRGLKAAQQSAVDRDHHPS